MRTVTLTRTSGPSDAEGTFGVWLSDTNFICHTVELPWRENATGISCIPKGTYKATWKWSEAHQKNLYHLIDVPCRSEIEIHSANLAGDEKQGFVSQLKGCIAPGHEVDNFPANHPPAGTRAQMGVTCSRDTLMRLEADMCREGKQHDFLLTIK